MAAPSVPAGKGDDPFLSLSPFEASEGRRGLPGGVAPPLLLSDAERTREALLSAAICVEHARIAGPSDSRVTARYASQVVDNSRALCGGNSRLHLNLLVSHRD